MLFDEPERDEFVGKIAAAPHRLISSATLLESSIVIEARRGEAAGRELDLFLHRAEARTVAFEEQGRAGSNRMAAVRQGSPPGGAEPRRPVRLRPGASLRRGTAVQGRQLHGDRYRSGVSQGSEGPEARRSWFASGRSANIRSMRWQNLSVEAEEPARLPGYRDRAVVRHFDAPEAVSTRFYEVRAKSILNRVPEASRMPFRWTINPYRGCTHACSYCVWGQTPVLMGDGRHRQIADLDVGAVIYGNCSGQYRRYVRTVVLDKWISVKPAVPGGLADRPHLTLQNRMVGTGQFAPQPAETRDYRRGYLCGVIRGRRVPVAAGEHRHHHGRPTRLRADDGLRRPVRRRVETNHSGVAPGDKVECLDHDQPKDSRCSSGSSNF